MSANKAAAQPWHSQKAPRPPPALATPLDEQWGCSPCTPHGLVGTQGDGEPPGIPLEMLDLCRGSRVWGSPAPGKKEGKQEERWGGRKCLFQCCHSKQSAPGNFASSVFALNSCFPTIHTDFGGPQHQSRCLQLSAVPAELGQEGQMNPSALIPVATNSHTHPQGSRSG